MFWHWLPLAAAPIILQAVLMHRWRYPTLSIHSIGSVCAPEGEVAPHMEPAPMPLPLLIALHGPRES